MAALAADRHTPYRDGELFSFPVKAGVKSLVGPIRPGGVPVRKKYMVRLTEEERKICDDTIDKLKGSSQKARRARILLQVDADGPGWTDQQVADAFSCRTKTVENVRRRCVLEGFALALDGKRRESPPVPKLLDGEQEAQVIALRLGPPPEGYANWSLRLLARRVVERGMVESISHETVNRTLKKTAFPGARYSIG